MSVKSLGTDEGAADAIKKFNGADFEGRSLTVNEARPVAPREGGGGGGSRFDGYEARPRGHGSRRPRFDR